MGKASRWFKGFLTGKKEKEKGSQNSTLSNNSQFYPIPSPAPRDKKRWSFRRPAGAAGKELSTTELSTPRPKSPLGASEADIHQKTHAMVLAADTDATMAAVQAASVVIRLSTVSRNNDYKSNSTEDEEPAAIKIQAVFRSYLARKALRALKGLVKLQALVRGYLVRKQATATLRCMQALVSAQARAQAQRVRTVEEAENIPERQFTRRRPPSPKKPKHPNTHDREKDMEENVKIVEMDLGESKGSTWSRKKYSIMQNEALDHKHSSCYNGSHVPYKTGHHQQVSPSPVALSGMSPRACSSHFEELSFNTIQSSPHYYSAICRPNAVKEQLTAYQQDDTFSVSNDHTYHPNYMANTKSSRAKTRSQSAPKQRPETCQRQSSRRRPSVEGRNIPRTKMQRSSSQVGTLNNDYHYPWSIKLDKSNASFKGSECGSNSTVLTNTYYCKSAAAYDVSHVTHEKHKIRA